MNERIKSIIDQVGTDTGGRWISVDNMEQFAELIVQDCIDILSPYTVNMNRIGEEYLHPIQEIRKHFGVKQ